MSDRSAIEWTDAASIAPHCCCYAQNTADEITHNIFTYREQKMNPIKIGTLVVLASSLAACAVKVPTNVLDGTQPKSKISIQFENFPEGTVCQAETPSGTVTSPSFPGRVEYPAAYRESPVYCTTPDNAVYDVLLGSVLPEGEFKIAGVTAYIDGFLVSTVSGESLTQEQNEAGVVKRK